VLKKILAPVVLWIEMVIASLGFPGIVWLMAIESACIPLPSEVIMPFAGYNIVKGHMAFALGSWQVTHVGWNLFLAGVAGALGCVLGSAVAYWVGIKGGRPFIQKYGKYALIRMRDIDRSDRWFQKWGDSAIFFSRLMPVVRTFISLPAGIARMPFWRFSLLTFLGSVPWCWFLAWIGAYLGQREGDFQKVYEQLHQYFHGVDIVILAVLAGLFAFWLWHHLKPDAEEAG